MSQIFAAEKFGIMADFQEHQIQTFQSIHEKLFKKIIEMTNHGTRIKDPPPKAKTVCRFAFNTLWYLIQFWDDAVWFVNR